MFDNTIEILKDMQSSNEVELWDKFLPYAEQDNCRDIIAKVTQALAELDEGEKLITELKAENEKYKKALKDIVNNWKAKSSPIDRDYNELVITAIQALKERDN